MKDPAHVGEKFFQVGGTLASDAPSYIERPADTALLEALEHGDLCLLLAPRQTGKSSLMVHAKAALDCLGTRSGIVDLQPLGSHDNADSWFSDIVYEIERGFKLEVDCLEWWEENQRIGPTRRFMTFLEDVLLTEIDESIVLFFDEVDSVLSLPFSDDFFTTLRALYNARSTKPILNRLSFVLLGVATPASFSKDHSRTPFNIGRSIELGDFDSKSTLPFQQALGSDCSDLVERIFYWTGGQPLMVQTLAEKAQQWSSDERTAEHVDSEVKKLYLEDRIDRDTHLKFIRDYLVESPLARKSLDTYAGVLKKKDVSDDQKSPAKAHLKLAGVVRSTSGKLRSRNRIYDAVFNPKWIRENRPSDYPRWIASGLIVLVVLGILWPQVLRPGLYPKFPEFQSDLFTPEASRTFGFSVAGSDVTHAYLTELNGEERELAIPENQFIEDSLAGLQEGPNTFNLRLLGGWFSEEYIIPLTVTYYPRWEIRQFPTSRHTAGVQATVFSPDGATLASASRDNTIKLWDADTGAEIRSFAGHSDDVLGVAFSPDGKTLASASKDNTLKLWDADTGSEIRSFAGHSDDVLGVAFSPDGKTLASASRDKTIKLWDADTGAEIRSFAGHSDDVLGVAFSPDGKTLASASKDKTLKLWDADTGAEIHSFAGHSAYVARVAFSPDGKTLASASYDKTLKLWDVKTDAEKGTLSGHSGAVLGVAFSPDGKTLASASRDETLKLWDIDTGAEILSLSGHSDDVMDVVFSPNGKTLASASKDETLKLWDIDTYTGAEIRSFAGHSGYVARVTFSPDGKTLASAGGDKTLKLWDIDTGAEIRSLSGHSDDVIDVAFSPDGKMLASTSIDKTLKLWDVKTDAEKGTLSGHSDAVFGVAFSPDGKTLASASKDETLKLWDIDTGAEIRSLSGHSDDVIDVTFSPDGKMLASTSIDKTIKLWDIDTGTEIRSLTGHSGAVYGVAFSPDGKTLASASKDETLKLWDIDTGAEKRTLSGHSDDVNDVVFSPNGKMLASASKDETLKIWDIETGGEIRSLAGHSDDVIGVAFSPDGKTLVSGSIDSTLKLWWAVRQPRFTDAVDSTPPLRSNGQPVNTLPAGTTQVKLSLVTNENADCRFSKAAGTDFDAMKNDFNTTTGLIHQTTLSRLQDGEFLTFNVRCRDNIGNTNDDDFIIRFRVDSPAKTDHSVVG